jgi:hypothetical protein
LISLIKKLVEKIDAQKKQIKITVFQPIKKNINSNQLKNNNYIPL